MDDQPPGRPDARADSALVIWLKLAVLLAGLSAFGLLIFWLARMAHHIG